MLYLLLLAPIFLTQAEADAPADVAAQVRRLVRQLDAGELDARNKAEEEVLKLGPTALESLPTEATGSAELQQRVDRIRQTLERRASDQAMQGSKVMLSGLMNLEDVAADIEKQTGNKIIDYRKRFGQNVTNPQFKLEIKNAPFWQAMDAMLDSTNMSVYQYSGKDGLAIIDRPEDESPRTPRAAYAGPLRLEATKISAERHSASKKPGTLKVNLEIAWEPRLSPIAFVQSLKDLEAVDDAGQKLQIDNQDATLEAPVSGGGTAVEMILPFVPPPRAAKTIATLKGTVSGLLPGKVEAFEFDHLEQAAKPNFQPLAQKKSGAAVTLEQVRKNNEVWEAVIRLKFDDAANALESHRGWVLENEAYLLGPGQQKIENAGYHSTLRTQNELGMAYQFELPGGIEGYTLVYRTPSSVHVLQLPYELKNLPLP